MSKQLIFILVLMAGAAIYYFSTPDQTRLGDDYVPPSATIQEADVEFGVGDTKKEVEKIATFYYKSDDVSCTTPIAVYLPDTDKRFAYQEISSIVTLLNNEKVPDGYKSPFIPGTVLNQLRISKGIAYVDLSTFLTLGTAPCEGPARKTLVRETLKQFEEIAEVKLLVDGVEVVE